MDIIADMFVVTPEWIHQHGKSGVGWTRLQLEALDVEWPIEKGWLSALAGKLITQEQRRLFEERGLLPRKKLRRTAKPVQRRPAPRFQPSPFDATRAACPACAGAGRCAGLVCDRCHATGLAVNTPKR